MQFYNTNDLQTDQARKSFAAQMSRVYPNGEAPLFAMSGLAKKKTALQIEHGYWSKTAEFAKITVTAGATASATTLTVDSSTMLLPNDILRAAASFSGGTFETPELMRVISITNSTTIEVERGFAGTTGAAITANDVFAGVGNAYPQGSERPASRAILPQRVLNNTQIFRNAWSQSKTLAAVKQIVGNGTVAENRMDCAFFHSRDIELATFFSRKSLEIDAVSGQPISTMDGIEALIQNQAPSNLKEASATTTYKQLMDMVDPVFDQKTDKMNGNSRVIYCGKTALRVFNDIGRLSGEYRIVNKQTSFGLKFTEFQAVRGTFRLIEHPIFNTHVEWQKMAVIADLSSFDFAYLEGRDTEYTYINEDKKSTDGQDATGGVITTELTIELQNPFAWGIIYGLTEGTA